MFAAIWEVLSLPLPHFRAIMHCSYKCLKNRLMSSSSIILSEILSPVSSLHNFWTHTDFLLKYVPLHTDPFSVVCCRRLLPCKKTKLVPSLIKTCQLLTWRLKTLWRFSKPKTTDIGSYSVQLFEDLLGVRFLLTTVYIVQLIDYIFCMQHHLFR